MASRNFSTMTFFILKVFLSTLFYKLYVTQVINEETRQSLPTVTVRGFLNFKTTVDGTVIVFTPAPEIHRPTTEHKMIYSSTETTLNTAFQFKDDFHSVDDAIQNIAFASSVPKPMGLIKTEDLDSNFLDNKINEPYVLHISDNVVLSSIEKNNDFEIIKKMSPNPYPTGLVTILDEISVEGTLTTMFETKVIGTFIEGKYAQILESTSHVLHDPVIKQMTTPKLDYSTVQHKETESQIFPQNLMPNLESKDHRNGAEKIQEQTNVFSVTTSPVLEILTSKTISEKESLNYQTKDDNSETKLIENKNIESVQSVAPPTTIYSSFEPKSVPVMLDIESPTESLESAIRKTSHFVNSFIPTFSSIIRSEESEQTTNIHKNNSSRTRFLPTKRPSQTVRLNRFKVKLTLRHNSADKYNVTLPIDDVDSEEYHTNRADDDIEIVTEDLGITLNPAKVVFQETTITSEVTLHVGRKKSVRTLTITTSVPLTINPTDIQDILDAESTSMDRIVSDMEHHIVTRTFTTTERTLKTSIVPVFDGKVTTYHIVTESFFIMKLITAYRTLPPGDASILESIFEEPEFGETTLDEAANFQPSVIQSPPEHFSMEEQLQASVTTLPPFNQSPQQLTSPFLPLSNNPLAAVYIGLQQLNAQITLYSTITDTSTYITTDTIYATKTVKFYDGRSTRYRTVSDPLSTKKRTITTTVTSVQPYLNTRALQQQQQLQKLIAPTQLPPYKPKFRTLTTTYTTTTSVTSLSTRIYTLIYNGFSTKFRTVTSSSLHPTTVIITSTTEILVGPTQINAPFAYPYSL